MRNGEGTNNVDHRVGQPILPLAEEGLPPGMEMSIGACEELSFALLLGFRHNRRIPSRLAAFKNKRSTAAPRSPSSDTTHLSRSTSRKNRPTRPWGRAGDHKKTNQRPS